MYLACIKCKPLQTLKAVRGRSGDFISPASPAGLSTGTGPFPGICLGYSRGPRCGIHHQFPWESISQPNTCPKWAELCDAQPKHFYFISLFLFMLLVLDKFKKLIMCHKKLMARTINILYNFTNPASGLFRFCDTLPACCISKCIKKNAMENFFFLNKKVCFCASIK